MAPKHLAYREEVISVGDRHQALFHHLADGIPGPLAPKAAVLDAAKGRTSTRDEEVSLIWMPPKRSFRPARMVESFCQGFEGAEDGHTGTRFSEKAFRPSWASGVAAMAQKSSTTSEMRCR